MSRFREAFANRHAILPVIHAEARDQSLTNAGIARDAGADGVFLINHSISCPALFDIYEAVSARHPGWWIGLNCLGLAAQDAFSAVPQSVDGLWTDDVGVDEQAAEQETADDIDRARKESGFRGLYFGGVAFKYQRPVDDIASAAKLASTYADVVTTSGPGTGQSASIAKIKRFRRALDRFPLAIASGISPDNVDVYLPYADCFLVATGISSRFDALDPELTRQLLRRVRAYRA